MIPSFGSLFFYPYPCQIIDVAFAFIIVSGIGRPTIGVLVSMELMEFVRHLTQPRAQLCKCSILLLWIRTVAFGR